MVSLNEFNKFKKLFDPYWVENGEGDSVATQAVIAVSKLIYKWYNDGDVYDNSYYMNGWFNDLSCYANWLYNRLDIKELEGITEVRNDSQYEELLYKVASSFNENYLEELNKIPKVGSIYTEDGIFEFVEYEEEDECEY